MWIFTLLCKVVILSIAYFVLYVLKLIRLYLYLANARLGLVILNKDIASCSFILIKPPNIQESGKKLEVEPGKNRQTGYVSHYNKLYYNQEVEDFVKGEDILLMPETCSSEELKVAWAFTAYKPVDRRVRPVSGMFPQEALV